MHCFGIHRCTNYRVNDVFIFEEYFTGFGRLIHNITGASDPMACLCRHSEGRRTTYSSNPRKTWVVSAMLRPLYPREMPGFYHTGSRMSPGASFDRAENLAATGARSPDRPARNKSLIQYSGRAECCER
jgi:hypothetical protein